ncbi:MAG TPA: tRNA uridine-5-carboxymethylaminomethyl(34) synthesis GTPase MnmE [Deltaproteobacteria bacterium]|nr:tRNA uridine-5-carboxymethylaminomethyl(34) synthesis GTPase MnmE [Deltaproteobacteria bacterium]
MRGHYKIMSQYIQDTIVAQITPVGEGAVGILRLSGPESVLILEKIFQGSILPRQFESHKLYYGSFVDPSSKKILDQVLAVVMKAPKSFTGEDVVEIHMHGGTYLLTKALTILQSLGARLAQAGEFSKRAFLNNKMDLTSAEAIADVIKAQSEKELENALVQMGGFVSKTINNIRHKLIEVQSLIEAGFDFSEEDIQFINRDQGLQFLYDIQSELNGLADSFQTGQLYRHGLKIALVGKPNVGKSSLLNALLKENKAIIHHLPGTTRDVIEGEKKINGIRIHFLDTAGLRKTEDPIEQEGIFRTQEKMNKADLVCLLLDSSQPLTEEDHRLLGQLNALRPIIIYSKADLPPAWSPSLLSSFEVLPLSSKTGQGLNELEQLIYQKGVQCLAPTHSNYVLNNVRYYEHILDVIKNINKIIYLISKDSLTEECLAEECRIISDKLGEITGEITSEDILDSIFSKFCIGK